MKPLLIAFTLATLLVCTQAYADKWDYYTSEDKMTSKTGQRAVIMSSGSLALPFPYSGDNYGTLAVRKHPQHGLDVIVSISKGQILCSSYDGCNVKVKFGDSQPITFGASPSDDHGSTTIFLRNPQKFITLAKTAKSIKVQITIYQAGGSVLEFDTPTPLVWGTPVAKVQSKAAKKEQLSIP